MKNVIFIGVFCLSTLGHAEPTPLMFIAQGPQAAHVEAAGCQEYKDAGAIIFYPSTAQLSFKKGDDFYLVGPKGAINHVTFEKNIDNEDCLTWDSIGSYTAATLHADKKINWKNTETLLAVYKSKPQHQQVGTIEKLKVAGSSFQIEINKHLTKQEKKEDQTVYEISIPGVFQKGLLVSLVYHKMGIDDEKQWQHKTLFFDNRGRHPKLSFEENSEIEPLAITRFDRGHDSFSMLVSSENSAGGTAGDGKFEIRNLDTKTLENKTTDTLFEWGD